ncbi:uncharacterized protein LOC111906914 [Lactuca sativa]|uniref:uncharacterized protein LOC111906914 n=1 Tax=Lactuca sativa TaxID=4236 RepID=UPI000CD9B67A|nr:uncharacterized protein LOC111906914 [Lactuca sativa]
MERYLKRRISIDDASSSGIASNEIPQSSSIPSVPRKFLEVLNLVRDQNEIVWKVTLQNAPGNNQMVAPCIQKDLARCFAQAVLNSIFEEAGDDDTSALSLKSTIDSLFAEYGLSLTKIRGQGYDGANKVEESIGHDEIETGSGLNQELSLTRVGDTCWNSHYETLSCLVGLFSSVTDVLEYVEDEGLNSFSQRQASGLRIYLRSFDFLFHLQLMLKILGIINILSQALQRKNQDIVNAISLVKSTTLTLKKMRNDGFDALILDITSFCEKNSIQMNMEDFYVNPKARRQYTDISNHRYYEFYYFNMVLDMQIQEFGDCFNEVSSELLICMAGLNPHDSFCDFDPSKLRKLINFYPHDFSYKDRLDILNELSVYPNHMQQDGSFANLKNISDLARVMVETKMH